MLSISLGPDTANSAWARLFSVTCQYQRCVFPLNSWSKYIFLEIILKSVGLTSKYMHLGLKVLISLLLKQERQLVCVLCRLYGPTLTK